MVLNKQSIKDLIKEVKYKYPIGTKFKIVHTGGVRISSCNDEPYDSEIVINGTDIHFNVKVEYNEDGATALLINLKDGTKKWAEIVTN